MVDLTQVREDNNEGTALAKYSGFLQAEADHRRRVAETLEDMFDYPEGNADDMRERADKLEELADELAKMGRDLK